MLEILDRKPEESSSGYHARLLALNIGGWSDQHLHLRAEHLWAVRAEIRREEWASMASCKRPGTWFPPWARTVNASGSGAGADS